MFRAGPSAACGGRRRARPARYAAMSLCFYLLLGGLFPRPPPDGLPVLLGPLGGVAVVS